jgi:predicted small metal-binding protein
VLAKIAEHIRHKHAVKTPTDTIVNFVRAKLRLT